jgi:hypothetical protein
MGMTDLEIDELATELGRLIAMQPKEKRCYWRPQPPYYRSDEIKLLLAEEFGHRHDWNLSRRWFGWGQLARRSVMRTRQEEWDSTPQPHEVADHCYYFRKDKRPAALAVHLYNWPAEYCQASVAAVCSKHGLAAREVTNFPSWWYPGVTHLIVYEPRCETVRSRAA